jgi:hypothetical protein
VLALVVCRCTMNVMVTLIRRLAGPLLHSSCPSFGPPPTTLPFTEARKTACRLLLISTPLPLCRLVPHLRYYELEMVSHALRTTLVRLSYSHSIFF